MASQPLQSKLKTSSATVVISLSLVLFLLGLVGWIFVNARSLVNHVKENVAVQVYLKEEAKEPDAERLKKIIDAANYTRLATFKSKEEAAEEMKAKTGDDFVAFLGFNPLPSAININLKADYANPDSISWIEKEIASDKSVREVVYQKVLIDNISKNTKKISAIILFFSLLLIVIAVALINNTIRLSIYAKRFLIRTMYLVGATQGFIRKPFIIKGIVNGVISGIIADILVVVFIMLANRFIPELLVVQNPAYLVILFLATIIVGILISGLSSALSVRKYLRLKAEDLHF
ncbi:MAG TPA: permease-like cell division protein FtsX [Bacteroidia bacterium]|jgi:cell division transport system permease protein|nr:permease-like cell division protein FtsX [Bacteroidia bacterium]